MITGSHDKVLSFAVLRSFRFVVQVITGSHDNTIRTWDIRTGKTLHTLTYHKKSVRALAMSPNEVRRLTAFRTKLWFCCSAWKLDTAVQHSRTTKRYDHKAPTHTSPCSNSPSWPSRSRCLVSVVTHTSSEAFDHRCNRCAQLDAGCRCLETKRFDQKQATVGP